MDYKFPFKEITKKDVDRRINNLRNYKWKIKSINYQIKNIPKLSWIEKCYSKEGAPSVIVHDESDYDNYNDISDYYNEAARMEARRYNFDYSPKELWDRDRDKIIQETIKKFGSATRHHLREYIYSLGIEATAFRPTLLAGAINEFNSKKVLDISAGWGDRLIAACAMNVNYYGVDPNPKTQEGYQKIIADYGNPLKQKIHHGPFETAPINEMYDLIFTSPPYFNLEIYNQEDPQQSVNQHTSLDSWFNDFLIFSIKKAWDHLIVGGKMCIVINNIRDHADFTMKMVDEINKFKDSIYEGVLSYTELVNDKPKSPQPIWIWTKIAPIIANTEIGFVEYPFNKSNMVKVFRDDKLYGGTKQRVAIKMFEQLPYDEFVYAGPENGFAQVAIGVAAKLTGKNAVMFTSIHGNKLTGASIRARQFGTKIIDVGKGTPLKMVQSTALKYVESKKNSQILPFGLDSPEIIKLLAKTIKESLPAKFDVNQLGHLWVAAGSAVVLRAMREVFPQMTLHGIQVGREIYPDLIPPNSKIHVSKRKFYEDAGIKPPYNSVANYDAKVWEIFLENANHKDNNFIWNVASDDLIEPKMPSIKHEYARWNAVQLIIDSFKQLNEKDHYEMMNIIERFLLSMANLPKNFNWNQEDQVFDRRILDKDHEINQIMLMEIDYKKIPIDKIKYLSKVHEIIKNFLDKKIQINDNIIKITSDGLITYGEFTRKYSPERIKLLRNLAPDEAIAIAALRYSSIISGAQHWNMPRETYRHYVEDQNVEVEGFSSPFNSQIIAIKPGNHFCSLFIDTDSWFGSLGSFFENNFIGKVVSVGLGMGTSFPSASDDRMRSVGPPYTVKLFNDIADLVIRQTDEAKKVGKKIKFLITMAHWPDVPGQIKLKNSKYKTYQQILESGKHFYENQNENDKPVTARFETIFIVIECGYPKEDYSKLLETMIIKQKGGMTSFSRFPSAIAFYLLDTNIGI